MFFGVVFYSFVVGALTSVAATGSRMDDDLETKMNALSEFADEVNLEKDLHHRIKSFFINNHREVFSRMEENQLID